MVISIRFFGALCVLLVTKILLDFVGWKAEDLGRDTAGRSASRPDDVDHWADAVVAFSPGQQDINVFGNPIVTAVLPTDAWCDR